MSDLYEILGVPVDATTEQIRTSYRRLLRQVHPDAGGNDALFRLIQEAWEVLGDPDKRRDYDRGRREATGPRQQAPKAGPRTNPQPEPGRGDRFEAARQKQRAERQRLLARRKEYEAVRDALPSRYRGYHVGWGVPLQVVLHWQSADRRRRWWLIGAGIILGLLAEYGLIEQGLWLGAIIGTVMFVLITLGLARLVLWAMRRPSARPSKSDEDLAVEFLRATSI